MAKFILGTKLNMFQVFDEEGNCKPATLLLAGPIVVTHVKNKESDGYTAIQVGFGERQKKNINRAQQGHFGDRGDFRFVKEFRVDDTMPWKVGDKIDVSVFVKGDVVRTTGISKGKGFQGVVKRHGFKGGPRTHGQKHSEREPGSIGVGGVQRVFKGMRMAGRMGGEKITVKNLQVLDVDAHKNFLVVSGAIPGRRGTLIEVRN
ncbi:MAG: 50S ribosomal protein L3 [Candidatus Yonathbacteria bacterium CG_4_10_14_3_um_filter_47_65]|uniref:Large ribosomal subunit protein uL3 n=2 Tax=Parcubacteria group TaxID=1794811 RepID=A0A2M8D5H7_9BACT|nr:MAG: 50S ribosomal protein L3 [Candidatus Nomurabacteria bacterium CG1_02_47_685]PIP04081.1 MAG: 50S ribosomal protein L3 [Candidatus Yonathbacteria bacterium CG23_combo_of_CG06-09_8_20_14_all_46_18]PIQ30934.1 MAG: 50S ribosomal protein L3 [Candidatus Yonathbacteria bacterium CG17_big_fil_post_rev_8_21_14_2_50_46_19]PIX56550.1 MAG: 50S ribosomal protein L3 [Candidatus Yonathbacteria bacterium CG_4_10_14_3_um_filter_47_65]PIY57283.1 MAG: 50S ribosomal protein L3 [Candidatus Yonathbacteria bac